MRISLLNVKINNFLPRFGHIVAEATVWNVREN